MNEPVRTPGPAWKKPLITIAGGFVILAGVIMLVIPGPGLLVIAGGLAILSSEYHWAHRILVRVRAKIAQAKDTLSKSKKS